MTATKKQDTRHPQIIAVSGGLRSAWAAYQACVAHRGRVVLVHVSVADRCGLRSDRACDLLVSRLRATFGDGVQYVHYQVNPTPGARVPDVFDMLDLFAPDASRKHVDLDARQLVAWLGRDVMHMDYCVSPPDCGQCDDCKIVRSELEV